MKTLPAFVAIFRPCFVVTLVVVLFFEPSVFGQIQKGNKYLWGSLGVPSHYFNPDPQIFAIKPSIAYTHFIGNGLAIHSEAELEVIRATRDDIGNITRSTNLDMGLSVRKYLPVTTGLSAFGGLGFGVNTKYYYGYDNNSGNAKLTSEDRITGLSSNFEIGMMYALSNRFVFIAKTKSAVLPAAFQPYFSIGFAYSLKPLAYTDTTTIMSQTQKKNWVLGGHFQNQNTKDIYRSNSLNTLDYSTTTQAQKRAAISIYIGRFIKNKKMVGVSFYADMATVTRNGTSTNASIQQDNSQRNIKFLTLSPYVKQYHGKGKLTFYTNVKANLSYHRNYYKSVFSTGGSDSFHYGFSVDYGFAYFLGKNIILESELGDFSLSKDKGQPRNIYFSLLNKYPIIGLNYVFSKK